jgi:photosystem II stability/assembly factor-like uncharacterized protein
MSRVKGETSPRLLSAWFAFGLAVALILSATGTAQAKSPSVTTQRIAVAQSDGGDKDKPGIEEDEDSADIPPFARKLVDREDYLRLRGSYYAELRGLPHKDPQSRSTALAALEAQSFHRSPSAPFVSYSTWTPVGPAPIPNGQTTTISNPVSGRVTSIAIHPTDPNIVYVGTAQGGVFRTKDGGSTWVPLMDSAQSLAIGAVALAPSDPEILYVGTGEPAQSCDSYVGVGVYRINNASTTANLTGPINPNVTTGIVGTKAFNLSAISKIVVHPTDPATVFVATMTAGIVGMGCNFVDRSDVPRVSLAGLYRSTNATAASPAFTKITVTSGGSIAPDTSGNYDMTDIVIEPGNPNTLLAWAVGPSGAGGGGVYRTGNALAATPTFSRTQGTSTGNARGELAINKVSSTVSVVAATEEGSLRGALRKSADGGVTWPSAITSLGAPGVGFCYGQCWYDIAVALDPANANIIYLGGSSNGNNSSVMVKSTNGTSFSRIDTGLHADMHAIAVAPSNSSVVYVGNDGGIFKSTNSGANWTSLNTSTFQATQFQGIAVHPTDPNFTLGGTQDNGTNWRKPDGTWFRADFGDGGYALIDQNAADTTNVTMYHTYFNQAGSLMGFARVTSTACASDIGTDSFWAFRGAGYTDSSILCGGVAAAANNGIGLFDSAVLFYAPMALGPGNPNRLYYATDRLYRSTNKGDTMTAVSQQFASGVPVTTIGISPQNDNVRIVATRDGSVYRTMTGANPMDDVTGSFPTNPDDATQNFISRAVIDPNDVNTAYVTFAYYAPAGEGIYKTTNLNSATPIWTAAANGIPSVPINSFVVDPKDSNHLFAGTDIGVYHSLDGGDTWTPFSNGLPRIAVFDLVIQPSARILRAATHGRGLWEIAVDKKAYLPMIMR